MYSLADFGYLLVNIWKSPYEDVVGSLKLVVARRIRSEHVDSLSGPNVALFSFVLHR